MRDALYFKDAMIIVCRCFIRGCPYTLIILVTAVIVVIDVVAVVAAVVVAVVVIFSFSF